MIGEATPSPAPHRAWAHCEYGETARRRIEAHRLLQALVGALLALFVLTLSPAPRQASSTVPSASAATLSAIPLAAQSLVSRTLGRDQRSYRVHRTGSGLSARNAAHGLSTRFAPDGILVRSGEDTLSLRVRAAGYGRSLRPVAPATPVRHANRVSFRRGPLTEWYANGPLGLEQGFALEAPPAGEGSGPLTLDLSLSGSLHPSLETGERSLSFAGSALRYTGLAAFDARGHGLRARLELRGRTLLIRVDDHGASYPLTIDPFFQQAELRASDPGYPEDPFGLTGVALSGNTIVVGGERSRTPRGDAQGAVYVFVKPSGGWATGAETARLTASDLRAGLGHSVAISGDTILAGAPYGGAGAAYVFVKPPGGWTNSTETAELSALPGAYFGEAGVYFGLSVAIAGDTIVAGTPCTPLDPTLGSCGPGAAYVFVKPPGGWVNATQTAKLTSSDGAGYDNLGGAVAIGTDGTIVAGASGADVSGHTDQGAAYVYVKPVTGWANGTQTAKLTSSDGAANDNLGISIGIAGDTVVSGAWQADVAGHQNQGAAYAFVRPTGGWANGTQTAKLIASDGGAGDHLGASLSISGDTVAAGASGDPFAPSPGLAGVYMFLEPGGGWSNATETEKLTPLDGMAWPCVGRSVATSGDTVVTGGSCKIVRVFSQAPATITVTKELVPASDPGRFDLKAAGKVVKAAAGNGGAGANGVAPGTYRVAETAAAGTNLSGYVTSIACTINGNPGPSADGRTQLDVTVADGDQAACTITNRRRPQVTLTKHLVPASDPGRFDLRVGGMVVKAGAGEGDTGSATVTAGSYTVSEVAAAGTTLLDYFSSIACTLNGQAGPSGTASSLNVTLTWGDVLACTITNKPGGTVTLTKQLLPGTDPGRFDLRVGQTLVKAGAGNGGSGSAQFLPGSYRVTESAAGGTTLSNYATSIACTVNGNPGPSANGTTQLTIMVAAGDQIACTLTNKRKATVTLTKHLLPAGDPGRFDLRVGGKVVKASAGNGDSGSTTAGAAMYTLSEVAAAGTNLADYSSSIACTRNGNPGPSGNGASLNVNVSWGDVLACTVTNQRK